MKRKFAFTLAETMIVLVVIGVLSAILLPVAQKSTANEKVLKAKRAYSTIGKVVSELVASDKYYLDGDLGVMPNGTLLLNDTSSNRKYFCQTIADVLNVKHVDCPDDKTVAVMRLFDTTETNNAALFLLNGSIVTNEVLQKKKKQLDSGCKTRSASLSKAQHIVTDDNVWYLELAPGATFGYSVNIGDNKIARVFSSPSQNPPTYYDSNGFDVMYKVLCMDIDGVPDNATSTDCVNECPFGYGIRADGKILNGTRVDEWLAKSIQDKD